MVSRMEILLAALGIYSFLICGLLVKFIDELYLDDIISDSFSRLIELIKIPFKKIKEKLEVKDE